MKFTTLTVIAALCIGIVSAQAPKKKAAATCPVCHMALSAKKTKTNTVAVKTKTGTMYCCAGCKMKK